jgi:predicted ribosomally synthesized peptide with SipW-like signal peptide
MKEVTTKMKSIFLSIVVISALVIAALGGTFATWSDSEVSYGNTIKTGSVDLLVNDKDDLPYGTGVPAKVTLADMTPCHFYGPFEVKLWDAGQHEGTTKAYIHVKELVCDNVTPKEGSGYADIYVSPNHSQYDRIYKDIKPEPELVAEYGGKVDCTEVYGIKSPVGDDCSMGSHITMNITTGNASATDGLLYTNDLGKYVCNELYLFELTPCTPDYIYLWFKLVQESEEDVGYDYIPDPWFVTPDINNNNFPLTDPNYAAKYQHWLKFNDWPSWAMMKDMATFDMEFDVYLPHVD